MPTQKRGGGKARKITAQVKTAIVEGMAAGHTLLDMCESVLASGVPDKLIINLMNNSSAQRRMAFFPISTRQSET